MKMVERIRSSAAKQGLTLTQLEQCLGFGTRTIYRWDKSHPSVDKVLAVANLLHVSLSWLVTGTYENTTQPFASNFELLSDTDKEKILNFMEISLINDKNAEPRQRQTDPDAGSQNRQTDQTDPDAGSQNRQTDQTDPDTEPIPSPSSETFQVPILGQVSAQAQDDGIQCLGYAQSCMKADYALVMGDTGMEPLIYPGEYIFVKNEKRPADGDIMILREDHRLVCRLLLKYPDHFVLRTLVCRTDAETVSPEDFTGMEIIGRVLLDRRQQDMLRLFFSGKI